MTRHPRLLAGLALAVAGALVVFISAGSPTPAAYAAAITSSATTSPDNPARDTSVTFSASVTSDVAQSVLIDIEVFNPSGTRVFVKAFDNQALSAGTKKTVSASWTIPSSEPTGNHTVKVGVFKPGWGTLLHWNNAADTFSVSADSSGGGGGSTGGKFTTLPPGSALPSDADCAARVRRSSWEPRPGNATANKTMPPVGLSLPDWTSVDSRANTQIQSRITGRFTGTTDEIIQWGACKWGFDEDMVRAMAAQESRWRQSGVGDQTTDAGRCQAIGMTAPCYQSYGLLQIKATINPGTWPYARDSTAFNIDYTLAVIRSCFEGYELWLNRRVPLPGYSTYQAGDPWGCLGRWFSGGWYDQGAVDYIAKVHRHLTERTWTHAGF